MALTMHPGPDDTLIQSNIQDMEETFFASLQAGPSQLCSFNDSWSSFCNNAKASADKLSADTRQRLYSLAHTIGVVTSHLVQCEETVDTLEQETSFEVSNLLAESFSTLSIRDDPEPTTHLPAYIRPSWEWLCGNLHNPYPLQSTRDKIAKDTQSPRKAVDAWFVDARKRIGWNTLRKDHFSNKRTEIVAAATQFFVSGEPLHPSIENKFALIEITARELYSDKLEASALATRLDGAVKDMTSELKLQINDLNAHNKREQQRRKRMQSYPTPSPERSPQPLSPAASTANLHETPAPPAQRRKRRSSEAFEDDASPAKRTRCEGADDSLRSFGLPSPTPSQDSFQDLPGAPVQSLPTTSTCSTAQSSGRFLKRKRRLSMSDDEPRSKRPHGQTEEPRRQTVSDPLPISCIPQLEEWFPELPLPDMNLFTELPPPVSVEFPDPTAPLDIELFNFNPDPFAQLEEFAPSPQHLDSLPQNSPALDGSIPEPLAADLFTWLNSDLSQFDTRTVATFTPVEQQPEDSHFWAVMPDFANTFPFIDITSQSTVLSTEPILDIVNLAPPVMDLTAQMLKDAKQAQLQLLEAKLDAIRAEIAAIA